MENVFIGNLTKLDNDNKVWEIMEQENIECLGETFNQTADLLAMKGEKFILEKLPQPLKSWVQQQIEEQTEVWKSVQMVETSIHSLGQYLIIKNIINTSDWTKEQKESLQRYIGWTWHLLHTEQ